MSNLGGSEEKYSDILDYNQLSFTIIKKDIYTFLNHIPIKKLHIAKSIKLYLSHSL